MSKYQIGDYVRIRRDLEKKTYFNEDGNTRDSATADMVEKAGQIVQIKSICYDGKYRIDGSGLNWTDGMFEGKVTKEGYEAEKRDWHYYIKCEFLSNCKKYTFEIDKRTYEIFTEKGMRYEKVNIETKNGNKYGGTKVCITDLIEQSHPLKIEGVKIQRLSKIVHNEKIYYIKGENGMNKIFKNCYFGKYNDENIKFSFKGFAYRTNDNGYVSYDKDKGTLTDVSDFLIDIDTANFLYMVPAGVDTVAIGDVIYNGTNILFVTAKNGNKIEGIDPASATCKTIVPVENLFGFNFVTKLVDITGGAFSAVGASAESPFGTNFLPFLLMSGEGKNDMLPLILAMNGGLDISKNPLIMLALMKDGDSGMDKFSELLPLMFLSGNNPFNFGGAAAPAIVAPATSEGGPLDE